MGDTRWAERLEQAKEEILYDVREGIVPQSVGSFGELHSYVDANEYGINDPDDDIEFNESEEPGGYIYELNALQNAVDAWITSGGIPPDTAGPHAQVTMALDLYKRIEYSEAYPGERQRYARRLDALLEGFTPSQTEVLATLGELRGGMRQMREEMDRTMKGER